MLNWILMGVSVCLIFIGYLWRRSILIKQNKKPEDAPQDVQKAKSIKRGNLIALIIMVAGGFMFITRSLD